MGMSAVLRALLQRVRGRPARMRSASAYRRGDVYFLVTLHGADGGDPCLEAGPVDVVPASASADDIGAAARRTLQRCSHDHPYPKNTADWKRVTQPLLSAAGARSWPAFAKQARSVRIDELGDTCTVLASTRDAEGAFTPASQHDVTLQRPSDRELGEAIVRTLALDTATGGS